MPKQSLWVLAVTVRSYGPFTAVLTLHTVPGSAQLPSPSHPHSNSTWLMSDKEQTTSRRSVLTAFLQLHTHGSLILKDLTISAWVVYEFAHRRLLNGRPCSLILPLLWYLCWLGLFWPFCYEPRNTKLRSLSHVFLYISEENQLQSGNSLCNLNPMWGYQESKLHFLAG